MLFQNATLVSGSLVPLLVREMPSAQERVVGEPRWGGGRSVSLLLSEINTLLRRSLAAPV